MIQRSGSHIDLLPTERLLSKEVSLVKVPDELLLGATGVHLGHLDSAGGDDEEGVTHRSLGSE